MPTPSVSRSTSAGSSSGAGDASEVHPMPPTALSLYGSALWHARPTETLLSQRQLAYAMGYPEDWRVERKIEISSDGGPLIVDTIHAVSKTKASCVWFHHAAAQKVASEMLERDDVVLHSSASHLRPPVPLYAKGNKVQVVKDDRQYDAVVQKRRRQGDSFLYTVTQTKGGTAKENVREENLKPADDPRELATELGFPDGWQATRHGSKLSFVAPNGMKLTSKKAALKYLKDEETKKAKARGINTQVLDMGDPPWRLDGHPFIGRRVRWVHEHQVSGTRKVTIDQEGTICGYIASTDKDSEGNPGFLSEKTGEPANLFHVQFPDNPIHPYPQHLLVSQDLEEFEVRQALLPEVEAHAPETNATGKKGNVPASSDAVLKTPVKRKTPSAPSSKSKRKKK